MKNLFVRRKLTTYRYYTSAKKLYTNSISTHFVFSSCPYLGLLQTHTAHATTPQRRPYHTHSFGTKSFAFCCIRRTAYTLKTFTYLRNLSRILKLILHTYTPKSLVNYFLQPTTNTPYYFTSIFASFFFPFFFYRIILEEIILAFVQSV